MSTIEHQILEEVRNLKYQRIDSADDDKMFKSLVLEALHFLLSKHWVMGTGDGEFVDEWYHATEQYLVARSK